MATTAEHDCLQKTLCSDYDMTHDVNDDKNNSQDQQERGNALNGQHNALLDENSRYEKELESSDKADKQAGQIKEKRDSEKKQIDDETNGQCDAHVEERCTSEHDSHNESYGEHDDQRDMEYHDPDSDSNEMVIDEEIDTQLHINEGNTCNDNEADITSEKQSTGENRKPNKLCLDTSNDDTLPSNVPKLEVNEELDCNAIENSCMNSPPANHKPIQQVFNKSKPGCHSTQTRYQTRTRSCSLPARVSRYSTSDDVPFACDTKISLIELANKLAAADRKINGKKHSLQNKPVKPIPVFNKESMKALKNKIKSLDDSDDNPMQPLAINLPTALIDPNSATLTNENGHDSSSPSKTCSGPESLAMKNFQVVKVDLFSSNENRSQNEDVKISSSQLYHQKSKPKFFQSDKVRSVRKSLEHAQKQQTWLAEAKKRELECVKQLEEQRAKEKKQSEEAATFNAMVYKFYDDVSKFTDKINAPPSDDLLNEKLPKSEGLQLWHLLSATSAKDPNVDTSSSFQATIDEAISKRISERQSRKRDHSVLEGETEELDIEGDINVTSGGLSIPDSLDKMHIEAITAKAVNTAIRHKIPKFARRGFEAAKYAADSAKKNVIQVEEARRDRESRGFGPLINVTQQQMYGSQIHSRPVGRPPKLQNNQSTHNNMNSGNIEIRPAKSHPLTLFTTSTPVGISMNNVSIKSLEPAHQTPPLKPAHQKLQLNPAAVAFANSRSESPQDGVARKHKCPECEYTTDNRSHLRRHVGSVHSDIKLFSCYVCNKEFARGEKCKAHIEREHPDVVYDYRRIRRHTIQLPSDTRNVNKDSPLDLSMNAENESKQFKAYEYGIMPAKHAHMAEEGQYEKKSDEDENSRQKKSSFQCPQCAYTGRDSWHLQRHLSDVHAAIRSLKCGICNYTSGRKHRMISHMKKHGELFCFYCDFSTTNITLFNTHLKLCTTLWRASMLTCEKCQRIYNTRKQLQTHLSNEHHVEMFFCDLCSYSTVDFQQFEKHSETHFSGDIESQCMKCNEMFEKAEELLEHNKTCPGVSSMIDENDTFKLKCSICTVTCNSISSMKEHLATHAGPTLKCHVNGCDFTARYESSIAQHLKLKHKLNEPRSIKPEPLKPTLTTIPQPILSAPPISISASSALSAAAFAAANAMAPGSIAFTSLGLSSIPIVGTYGNIQGIPIYASPHQMPVVCTQSLIQPPMHSQVSLQQPSKLSIIKPKQSSSKPRFSGLSVPKVAKLRPGSIGFDDDSGGPKGHGSGTFVCPYCSDRPPFKYRRSYEKHMYKHQKEGRSLTKLCCPYVNCPWTFTSTAEVERHVFAKHGTNVIKIEPDNDLNTKNNIGEVIDLDSSPEKTSRDEESLPTYCNEDVNWDMSLKDDHKSCEVGGKDDLPLGEVTEMDNSFEGTEDSGNEAEENHGVSPRAQSLKIKIRLGEKERQIIDDMPNGHSDSDNETVSECDKSSVNGIVTETS